MARLCTTAHAVLVMEIAALQSYAANVRGILAIQHKLGDNQNFTAVKLGADKAAYRPLTKLSRG